MSITPMLFNGNTKLKPKFRCFAYTKNEHCTCVFLDAVLKVNLYSAFKSKSAGLDMLNEFPSNLTMLIYLGLARVGIEIDTTSIVDISWD